MHALKTNVQEMCQALAKINEQYAGNVVFSWNLVESRKIHFRLKVLDNGVKGARFHVRDSKGYRSTFACWHVHGHFFEALFAINPDAVIWSAGKKITSEYGNWEDKNVGSQMNPVYFSESCLCNSYDRYQVKTNEEFIKKIASADINTLKDIWDELYGAFRTLVGKHAKQLKGMIKAMSVNELHDLWKYGYFRPLIARWGNIELAPLVVYGEESVETNILKRRLAA